MLSSFVSGPISYRLGNQRRLKYAPPPDLTSNTSKQYSAPATQPLLTPHNPVPTPNIFNPNEPVGTNPTCQPVETSISTNSPSLQRSTPEHLSQANSLQDSFRSSPVAIAGVAHNSTGTSGSVTPQSQNSNLAVPATQPIPEPPTTPQNTPANVNYFGSYDTYNGALQRDLPSTRTEKGAAAALGRSQVEASTLPKEGVEAKPGVTFAPVSAVQVTEKLEHLLAEREQDPLPGERSRKIEDATECRPIANYDDVKLASVEERNDLSRPDVSSDVFSERKEGSEITHSTITCQEASAQEEGKFDGTRSHGVSSNVQSVQQYYQPQLFASSAGFFAGAQERRRSNLTYIPATEASTNYSTDPSKIVAQPASSFFDKPEETGNASFPVFQYKENTNAPLIDVATLSRNNDSQQQVPAACSPIESTFANPQASRSPWDTNRISEIGITTYNAAAQSSQQPLFYNPAQFQDELPKQIPTYTPPPVTSQHYFDNFTGSTCDITSGIGIEFPTAPSMTVLEPTGSATLNPVQMSINPLGGRAVTDGVPPSFQSLVKICDYDDYESVNHFSSLSSISFSFISFCLFSLCLPCFTYFFPSFFQAAGSSDKRMQYRGVYHHWFYRKKVEHKVLWVPFSMQDSLRLEGVHNSTEITPETTVATDGGRYDVDILRRQRSPVYWSGESTEVRRCSWFFKGPTESRYVPYDENTACKLEEEYKQACLLNNWNRRIDLNNGEYIIFHSASVQVHYLTAASPELAASWGNSAVNNTFYLIFLINFLLIFIFITNFFKYQYLNIYINTKKNM